MASTTLDKLRDDVSELKTSFEKFSRQTIQVITSIEEESANASNDQKEWKDVKQKLATMSLKGKVKLDVGGDIYSTSVETLTREKDTFFTALFSKQWEIERDPDDKSIFIDRNGKLFIYILDYLRNDEVPCAVMNNEILQRSLMVEAKYFRLHGLIQILTITFHGGTLLEREQMIKLNEFYGNLNQGWELIYKASRDGFDANAFHSHCNSKGPTMTIFRSNNNYLFGGYTSVAWTSNDGDCNDTNAFLFTLTNPHGIPPTKYHIGPGKASSAIRHRSTRLHTFGSGEDLRVEANSNSNNSSYTTFPSSYIDTTGKQNNTFTGAKNFSTSEIEVFQLA